MPKSLRFILPFIVAFCIGAIGIALPFSPVAEAIIIVSGIIGSFVWLVVLTERDETSMAIVSRDKRQKAALQVARVLFPLSFIIWVGIADLVDGSREFEIFGPGGLIASIGIVVTVILYVVFRKKLYS